MEPWTIIVSIWLSTWFMLMWRTYSVSMRMIGKKPEGRYIIKYKGIHFIIYAIGMFVMTPFIWQIVFFEESRRRWVIAYVNGILGIKK